MLEGKGYCNWLMVDLEGTKEIKEINFTFEKNDLHRIRSGIVR